MISLATLTATFSWNPILIVFSHNSSPTLAADASSDGQCYYPNGLLTKPGRPCTHDGSPSNCCSAGFQCMNTGICKLDGVEYYERQSCTDSNWLDPSCSQMCIEDRTSSNYSVVKACINENMNKTVYCCNKVSGHDADCCNNPVSGLERWDYGSKDVSATAFISKDGSFHKLPESSDGDIILTVTAPTLGVSTETLTATEFQMPEDAAPTPVTVVETSSASKTSASSTESTSSTVSLNSSTTTTSSALSNVVRQPPAVNTDPTSKSSTANDHRSTIIGVAIGVPLGLLGITLLSFILHRHLKNKALNTSTKTVCFPPDPIDPFATRIIPEIELDATNAVYELDGATASSELDNSVSVELGPKRSPSAISELGSSPVTPSGPADRTSVTTAPKQNRWSKVSSLAPLEAHYAPRARPSIAETLSIVSQQHHGSGQDVFLTALRPRASHRLSRPTSGLLPEIEGTDDEIPLTPKSNNVVIDEPDTGNAKEDEKADTAKEVHEAEQVSVSETARTSGEAVQAGQNAAGGGETHAVNSAIGGENFNESDKNAQLGKSIQVGKSFYDGEIAGECEASRKSGKEEQVGEVVQAGEFTTEIKPVNKGKEPQENAMNAQAGDDSTKADEKLQKDGTAYECDTQT